MLGIYVCHGSRKAYEGGLGWYIWDQWVMTVASNEVFGTWLGRVEEFNSYIAAGTQ